MSTLSINEIYRAARQAGFSPRQAVTWTAIALAESGGNPDALNDQGEHSVGLWQINIAADRSRARRFGDLRDPLANARAAYEISRHGTDMRPWTVTHDRNQGGPRDYRRFLRQVEEITGVEGDDRGVDGYGATLPPPLPESTTSQQDDHQAHEESRSERVEQDGAQTDRDRDGLTDAFESLVGTDRTSSDTDHDGITDGDEAYRHHTDPLKADTDGDGRADGLEIAQRTNAGSLPGIGGVVGTGPLAENVRHRKDSDHDGLSDKVERQIGTKVGSSDSDGDRLNDSLEVSLGTGANDADTDDDGVTDGHEHRSGTDPLASPTATVRPLTLADAAAKQAQRTRTASSADQTSPLATFLGAAKAQAGDRYVYGARLQPGKADPTQFDCSSLTAWAASQAGVELPRTAEYQYMQLKKQGMTIPVEDALRTKGALLFYFSTEPKGGLPAGQAHVAISTGDGRTIEARGRRYGVGEWAAAGRFNYAAVIPGISDPESVAADSASDTDLDNGAAWGMPAGRDGGSDVDSDGDGLTDDFERLLGAGTEPADTDRDGLHDVLEASLGTRADRADTDGDGLSDRLEYQWGTNPLLLTPSSGTGDDTTSGAVANHDQLQSQDLDNPA